MAFESLTDKLQNVFKNLRKKGRLTEADVKAALKEVKMALLEADGQRDCRTGIKAGRRDNSHYDGRSPGCR